MTPDRKRRAVRVGLPVIAAGTTHVKTARRDPPPMHRLDALLVRLDVPSSARRAAGAVGFDPMNASVTRHGDKLVCAIRMFEPHPPHRSRAVVGEIDPGSWRLGAIRPMRAPDARVYEDVRLFSWGGRLAACATVGGRISVLDLDEACGIAAAHDQPTSTKRPQPEKNWSPCVDGEHLVFVYTIDDTGRARTLRYDPVRYRVPAFDTAAVGTLRGSSQVIPCPGGGWLTILHERHYDARGYPVYTHRIARLDASMAHATTGPSFYLNTVGIEFVAGAAWAVDGSLVISFGVADREAWLAVATPAQLSPWMPPHP